MGDTYHNVTNVPLLGLMCCGAVLLSSVVESCYGAVLLNRLLFQVLFLTIFDQ